MKKEYVVMFQAVIAAAGAYLSAKLGVLFPVLCVLMAAMVIDYFTGMLASKVEAMEHPGDTGYGWSSKKGAMGIIKKTGYIAIITVALMADYALVVTSEKLDFQLPVTTFFSLLVAVWYLLNEFLSIIENAGRMGANVPEWLRKYIAVLKDTIDKKVE